MTLLDGPCTWICSCVGSLGASQLVLGPVSATEGHLSVFASQRGECCRSDQSMRQAKGPSVSLGLQGTTQFLRWMCVAFQCTRSSGMHNELTL